MAESPVATTHAREDALSPARTPAAPESGVLEAGSDAAAQAVVRALHPAASAGSGGTGSGGAAPPGAPGWTPRTNRVSPRDLMALQRMAGNRAVTGLVAHRPPGAAPASHGAATHGSATATVQRKPTATVIEPSLDDIQVNPPAPPEPYPLQYQAENLDEAALSLSKDLKVEGDAIIIGVQPKFLIVYGKNGNRLTGKLDVKLPEGVTPMPGVFMSPSSKDATDNKRTFPLRQVTVDATTKDWKLGGYVSYLKQQEKGKGKPGAPAPAAGQAGDPATSPPVGAPDNAAATAPATADDHPAPGTGPDKNATPGAGDPTKGRKPLPMLSLRSYITNGSKLDEIIDAHNEALQFYLVPEPKPGSGKKPGGGSTTGFAGEVEGKGPPPNAPPWPVNMDGPRMQPADSKGAFSARINWAANNNNAFSDQVISAVGNYIHYRWEVFDITEFAKRNEQRIIAQAQQTKALLKAADAAGIGADTTNGGGATPTPAAAVKATAGGTSAAAGGGGAGAAAPGPASSGPPPADAAAAVAGPASPSPSSAGDPGSSDYQDAIDQRLHSVRGSGTDPTAETRNRDFRRSFEELWDDTSRAGKDLAKPAGSTWSERQSNAQANLISIELLPVSFVITSLGAGLRWVADLFAGEQDNQEIHFGSEGVYLVRVITTPEVVSDREGKPVIRPSSVAHKVIEVVKMDRMLKEGLDDPAAQLANADAELATATRSGNQDRIAAAQEARDLKALETEGNPIEYLTAKIAIKEREAARIHAKWDGIAVGPIIDVERELDTLRSRLKVFRLQEGRRTDGATTLAPPKRVKAALVSEVTGQTYPLMLSIGPMKPEGNRHVWKVLDATGEDAVGFDGYGETVSDAIRDAFRQFGGKAAYGRGKIGVRLPDTISDVPVALREFQVDSLPTGWAVARARLDDLVMTLAALGLFVASAGTASIAIGAAIAAARLIERAYNGTLRLDAAAVSDVLAILGAVGAAAHGVAEVSVAAAGVKFQKIGESMVMLEEGVTVSRTELDTAAKAMKSAGSIASKIEKANEVINYAGIVWGNVSFFNEMLDTAELEAKGPDGGGITHAEARRRRASGIAGAINNDGMAVAPHVIKGIKARRAAGKTGAPSETHVPSGLAEPTPKPDTTPVPGEPGVPRDGTPVPEPTAPREGSTTDATTDTGTAAAGGGSPTEAGRPGETGTGAKPATTGGEHAGGTTHAGAGGPGADASGGGHGPTTHATAEPAAPKPGSPQEHAAAHKALQDAARGNGDIDAAAANAIGKGGTWKEGLKRAVSGLEGEQRVAAEKALVDARERIVNEEWAKIQDRYQDLKLENAGTKSFSSDIDATVRPKEEARTTGQEMAEQIDRAAKASQELADALRVRVGGETDAVIDTNIYSFIGEGRVKPSDPASKGAHAQQHVDVVVGLAEQMRGQSAAQFHAFEQSLVGSAGDPRVAAEARRVLGDAREFHDARQREWRTALADAGAPSEAKATEAQKRAARESILGSKKGELGPLTAGEPPNFEAIARKQSEINWFAPDAYATPSAFKEAVAHGQRLKGTARTAAEWKATEVTSALRDAAAKLPPDSPRAKALELEGGRVESQQRLLEMTVKELRELQDNAPVDKARSADLQTRAKGLQDAIARSAEPFVIAGILGETMPAGRPGPERLSEAAAASGANLGMLEAHVAHAPDLDGRVKAAAKYGGRISLAEFLGGLRPSPDPVARLIGDFVKSRWGIMEDVSPQIMRDMFVRYAELTGRHTDLAYNDRGEAVGASDALKKAFVSDVTDWARATNREIQTAAIGSKAFDNPSPTTPSLPEAGGAARSTTGAGEQPAPAGSRDEASAGPTEQPAPAQPHEITSAGGATKVSETPPIDPPGLHQPFEFRLSSLREGEATIRRIANGDVTALTEHGVTPPSPGYKTQGREFGLARMPDGTYAIIQGDAGGVRWSDLPRGAVPLAHTHPLTPDRALSKPGTVGELIRVYQAEAESPAERQREKDAIHVLQSPEDVLFVAANGIVNHDVHTGYVHTGDGVLRNPTGAAGELAVSFNLFEARHTGNMGHSPVVEAAFVAHDSAGNVLYIGRVWVVNFEPNQVNPRTMMSFNEIRPTSPPDPSTLLPMHATPAGSAEGPRTTREGADAAGPTDAKEPGRERAGAQAGRPGSADAATPEAIPGGFTVSDDGYATTVKAKRDPNALVRIEPDGKTLKMTDVQRRDLPAGTGSALLAEGLKAVKAGPGSELLIHGIINPETVASHEAGGDPADSKLGKMADRALESIGLTARSMRWEIIRGKLCILVVIE